ncbi:hypothetical protein FRC10_008643 [Ceratobasidium sp. 414]|nr:hypothetical protein FRC10_008643 [Ceratobasidium sp. 414]
MFALIQTVAVIALSGLALAVPTPTKIIPFDKRTISGVTGADCDGFTFTPSQVAAAASAAATYIARDVTAGSNSYPHVFNNREGFGFNSDCSPPYYEFPLFRSKTYTGGDPSYNRVIIGSVSDSGAEFCGVVTHRGARGNNFLQCDQA